MSPLIELEIICVQDENREKFDLLQRSALGWGVKRLHFASTDALGLMYVQRFGIDQVIVLIGEFTFLVDRSQKREEYLQRVLRTGVSEDQIVLLEGNETPEQIEDLVREKIFKILQTTSA